MGNIKIHCKPTLIIRFTIKQLCKCRYLNGGGPDPKTPPLGTPLIGRGQMSLLHTIVGIHIL